MVHTIVLQLIDTDIDTVLSIGTVIIIIINSLLLLFYYYYYYWTHAACSTEAAVCHTALSINAFYVDYYYYYLLTDVHRLPHHRILTAQHLCQDSEQSCTPTQYAVFLL